MKRIVFLAAMVLMAALPLMAQKHCVVNQSDYRQLKLTFTADATPTVGDVTLDGVSYNTLSLDGYGLSSAVGAPALPTLREMIEVPLCSGIQVSITSEEHLVVSGDELGITAPVAPLQPSLCKTPSRNLDHAVVDEAIYGRDAFYSAADLVSTEMLGIARDRNLAQVIFSPVSYNPITNQFTIYTRVEATLTYLDVNEEATREMKAAYYSPLFSAGATLNQLPSPKAVRTTAPVRMLILANSMFRGKIDSFVMWKRRIGYIVDVAFTGDEGVGTNLTSLTAYAKSQYTNATAASPAPTFVLLVGDKQQMPAQSYSDGWDSHVSDLDYVSWTDGDNLPDAYCGRLSAQTIDQLLPQIEKILMYEQYTFPDPTFLDRAVLVAGIDGGYSSDNAYKYADPAMDYAAKFYVNGNYGYTQVNYYKNATSINPNAVNVTVASNRSAATVRQAYNQGAGWINYSAHGSATSWGDPELNTTQVAQMTNNKKFGIMIGNCCLSGKFDESTCFGEALLRKDDYAGAAAYIGGSNSTYWGEDFYWAVGIRNSISGSMTLNYDATHMGIYDRLFHTHDEAFSEWATSMGAMMLQGNMAVQNSNSSLKAYYWQIYHTFGDPSMMPWLTQANDMTLSQSGFCYGATSVSVSSAPFSYVAITDPDRKLLGAAYADASGHATVTITAPTTVGTYELAATAQNYKPAFLPLNIWPASVSEADESHVAIYPNPATDRLTILADDNSSIAIYDMMGRLVITAQGNQNGTELNISTLPNGVYYVKVTTSGMPVVKTVIKK